MEKKKDKWKKRRKIGGNGWEWMKHIGLDEAIGWGDMKPMGMNEAYGVG